MSTKRILIVDDEVSVLSVLKGSLKKLSQDIDVFTAENAFDALAYLQKHRFDLIVTDFSMDGLNGLELMNALRYVQPQAKVIMITAYSTDELQTAAQKLRAYRYMTKPLELDTFRHIVVSALEDVKQQNDDKHSPTPPIELPKLKPKQKPLNAEKSTSEVETESEAKLSPPPEAPSSVLAEAETEPPPQSVADADVSETVSPRVLVLSNESYEEVTQLLGRLISDVGGRCAFLTNAEGRLIARSGDAANLPIEKIASLLGGGFATLIEAGRTLDGKEDIINLTYREGKNEYLYALNIGQDLLLILVVDRSAYSSRLGSVWYYSQQTALKLQETLVNNRFTKTQRIFEDDVDDAFDDELDKLFNF